MKQKIRIIILLILVILAIFGIWLYLDIKENERLDRESVTLKEDLSIEYGKDAKVSDFLAKLDGEIVDDFKINTENLGETEVNFEYINIKKKKRKYAFTIKTVDVTPPKILCGASLTVKTGHSKNLTDSLLSGDDLDDNPKREIVGNYDINVEGDYALTYVVTDASGNKTNKEFVLHVRDKIETAPNTTRESVYFDDIIDNYKTNDTKIGIDVSKWQGEIDWEKVKNAGAEFAIIRVRISNRL